ncbi:MAG: hypothetical protein OEY99_04520 [Aigarchaeota archaeon]|nr:hypothetical protein [Aigarchaeota archaeon]
MTGETRREERTKREITAAHVFPVLLTVAVAWVYTLIVVSSQIYLPPPALTPIEEPPSTTPQEGLTNPAPYLNMMIFIGYVAVGGVIVYVLTSRFPKSIKYLAAALFGLSGFAILYLYGFMLMDLFHVNVVQSIDQLLLAVSLLMAGLLVLMLWSKRGVLRVISASIVGAGAGVYLGASMPLWTTLVIIVGISLYDIVAVYKGPLGRLAQLDLITLRGLVVDFMDVFLGLGDIVFYSMLIAFSYWHLTLLAGLAATAGILVGFGITLLAVKKGGPAPGLPASLIIGLGLALLTTLL